MNKKFDLDEQLKAIASDDVQVPVNLASTTAGIVLSGENPRKSLFPYVVALVFVVNILVSILFGGVLFLMRPISIIEWVIIGSVYSTVNILLYGITFMHYEKVQDVLRSYSIGGR